jgi:nitrous oxidase accessory protein
LHVVSGESASEAPGSDLTGTQELRGDGVWLFDSVDTLIRDSVMTTVRDGVQLTYSTGAVIEDVVVHDSRYGLHDMFAADATFRRNRLDDNLNGIVLMYGGPVLVQDNVITQNGSANTGYGVLIKDAGGVRLLDNVIADNRVGVLLDDAGRTGLEPTHLEGNMIAVNQIGVILVPSADSTLTANAFTENTTQVSLGGTGRTQAVWVVDGIGNHWSDYGGFDAGGDGIGDLPYTRSGRTSQLIAEQPLLLALASGPAFRLLSAVEDRWAPGEPLVLDEAPLVRSTTPAVAMGGDGPAIPLWIPGSLLMLVCLGALWSGRRRVSGRG